MGKRIKNPFKTVPHVMVCVPNTGSIATPAVMWLLHNAWGRPNTFFYLPNNPRPADHNRNEAVKEFLNTPKKVEWILFMDSDMIPPPEGIDGLLRNHQENPKVRVVSGVAHGWMANPDRPPGVRIAAGNWVGEPGTGDIYFLNTLPEAPVEVDACGSAFMLVHRSVIEDVVDEFQACFRYKYNEYGKVILGEDLDFCVKIQKCGHKIILDPRVRLGHLKEVDLAALNKYIIRNALVAKDMIERVFKDNPDFAKSTYERISEMAEGVYDPSESDLETIKKEDSGFQHEGMLRVKN